jgi:CRISPR/Cas system-associated endonuclease Cas1
VTGTRLRVDGDDEGQADRALASLVLTVVELLRQLMERQAIRRVEDGTVTDEQAERLGYTLMRLDERMGELLEQFGLEREDLNLDLGPLGTLL